MAVVEVAKDEHMQEDAALETKDTIVSSLPDTGNIETCFDLDGLSPELFEYLTAKQRKAIPDEDYAWPDAPGGKPLYPIDTQAHLDAAATLIGHAPADKQGSIKARAKSIAKRKGFTLPKSWQDEDSTKEEHDTTTQESLSNPIITTSSSSSTFTPRAKIATLTIPFVADDAISLNQRQYPREAVDRLVQSAQIALSDPNAPAITCYTSHGAADEDNSLSLIGRATHVNREGKTAYAQFDIADTNAGRDMVALVSGGYIKTMSLRASGATLQMEKGKSLPQVGGSGLRLEGVDFTIDPGLPQVAQIQDIVLETKKPSTLRDFFMIPSVSLTFDDHQLEGQIMSDKKKDAPLLQEKGTEQPSSENSPLKEDHIEPMTSGVTQGVTDGPTKDDYSNRQMSYIPPIDTSTNVGGNSVTAGMASDLLKEAHDHIAAIQGRSCAPAGMESAKQRAALLQEAGKTLSGKNDQHLDAAHDRLAKALKMNCEGAMNKNKGAKSGNFGITDPDGDGDNDNAESQRPKEAQKKMTPDEMVQLLAEAGYQVQRPKTEEEKLQEKLDAQRKAFEESMAAQQKALEEQRKAMEEAIAAQKSALETQLAEMKTHIEREPIPQRRSLVEGATVNHEVPTAKVYKNGDYLKEQLLKTDFALLADRTAPLPENVTVERLLEEMKAVMLAQYDKNYGLTI